MGLSICKFSQPKEKNGFFLEFENLDCANKAMSLHGKSYDTFVLCLVYAKTFVHTKPRKIVIF